MSLLMELHAARKARLKRIAQAGAKQARKERVAAIAATPIIIQEPDPEPDPVDAPIPPSPGFGRIISAKNVIRATARHFGITVSDIMSQRRKSQYVHARHVAMTIVKQLTEWSLPHIGKQFGNRDHTTVLHAVTKVERWLAENHGTVAEDIAAIKLVMDALGDRDAMEQATRRREWPLGDLAHGKSHNEHAGSSA